MKHFKRNFVRILLVLSCVFTGGRVNAESSLPPCRGDYNETTWTDCVGTKTNATGSKYVGQFRDGKPNGQGTAPRGDGSKYVGEWKDGNLHGQGTLTPADGSEYVGEFRDGKYHGQGTFTDADGKTKSGEWRDGEYYGK